MRKAKKAAVPSPPVKDSMALAPYIIILNDESIGIPSTARGMIKATPA